MARDKRIEAHETGEKKPCAECRAELALLRRAQGTNRVASGPRRW